MNMNRTEPTERVSSVQEVLRKHVFTPLRRPHLMILSGDTLAPEKARGVPRTQGWHKGLLTPARGTRKTKTSGPQFAAGARGRRLD